MKNHIWVVEGRFDTWVPMRGVQTRKYARWTQKNVYAHLATRIRKYVPA